MHIICIILLLVTTGSVYSRRTGRTNDKDKNCNQTEFDRHSSNVFGQFGLSELQFPETRTELNRYCRKARESTDFAKQYGQNCLKGTSQTLMSLASYNFDKVNKQYCAKNGKLKEQWVTWSKCGNAAKDKTKKCWDIMVLTMANTKKVKNSKSRIPIVCCTYYEWIKCTRRAMEEIGGTCTKEAIDGFHVHINKASVDSMNLICSRYEDNKQKCDTLAKEVSTVRPKRMHKMPLLYVFDIFDSL